MKPSRIHYFIKNLYTKYYMKNGQLSFCCLDMHVFKRNKTKWPHKISCCLTPHYHFWFTITLLLSFDAIYLFAWCRNCILHASSCQTGVWRLGFSFPSSLPIPLAAISWPLRFVAFPHQLEYQSYAGHVTNKQSIVSHKLFELVYEISTVLSYSEVPNNTRVTEWNNGIGGKIFLS